MIHCIRPLEKNEGKKLEALEADESPEVRWKCMRKCLEILHDPKNPLAYVHKCESLCKKKED